MQLEKTWRWWGLRRKRLRTGKDGDVKSAVVTPKGSSRKKKKKNYLMLALPTSVYMCMNILFNLQ